MLNERLRRVTDLFVEGTELYFGLDDDQQPIVLWVNKLNSFEVEEARRDAMVKRGIRIAELSKDDTPEVIALKASLDSWDDHKLAQRRVEQLGEEIYLEVLNDIEAEEGWREKIDIVRRGYTLLDDEGAAEDDPRRAHVLEVQKEYITKVNAMQRTKGLEKLREIEDQARATNVDEYLEHWRSRESLEIFMTERRVSELYVALRDCKAAVKTNAGGDPSKYEFNHEKCDHSQRLLKSRSEVYDLPESVIERAGDVIDGITVPVRDAGNSAAPESSSVSSEPSSAPEEASTPSIPEETPLAVPTT